MFPQEYDNTVEFFYSTRSAPCPLLKMEYHSKSSHDFFLRFDSIADKCYGVTYLDTVRVIGT